MTGGHLKYSSITLFLLSLKLNSELVEYSTHHISLSLKTGPHNDDYYYLEVKS